MKKIAAYFFYLYTVQTEATAAQLSQQCSIMTLSSSCLYIIIPILLTITVSKSGWASVMLKLTLLISHLSQLMIFKGEFLCSEEVEE